MADDKRRKRTSTSPSPCPVVSKRPRVGPTPDTPGLATRSKFALNYQSPDERRLQSELILAMKKYGTQSEDAQTLRSQLEAIKSGSAIVSRSLPLASSSSTSAGTVTRSKAAILPKSSQSPKKRRAMSSSSSDVVVLDHSPGPTDKKPSLNRNKNPATPKLGESPRKQLLRSRRFTSEESVIDLTTTPPPVLNAAKTASESISDPANSEAVDRKSLEEANVSLKTEVAEATANFENAKQRCASLSRQMEETQTKHSEELGRVRRSQVDILKSRAKEVEQFRALCQNKNTELASVQHQLTESTDELCRVREANRAEREGERAAHKNEVDRLARELKASQDHTAKTVADMQLAADAALADNKRILASESAAQTEIRRLSQRLLAAQGEAAAASQAQQKSESARARGAKDHATALERAKQFSANDLDASRKQIVELKAAALKAQQQIGELEGHLSISSATVESQKTVIGRLEKERAELPLLRAQLDRTERTKMHLLGLLPTVAEDIVDLQFQVQMAQSECRKTQGALQRSLMDATRAAAEAQITLQTEVKRTEEYVRRDIQHTFNVRVAETQDKIFAALEGEKKKFASLQDSKNYLEAELAAQTRASQLALEEAARQRKEEEEKATRAALEWTERVTNLTATIEQQKQTLLDAQSALVQEKARGERSDSFDSHIKELEGQVLRFEKENGQQRADLLRTEHERTEAAELLLQATARGERLDLRVKELEDRELRHVVARRLASGKDNNDTGSDLDVPHARAAAIDAILAAYCFMGHVLDEGIVEVDESLPNTSS